MRAWGLSNENAYGVLALCHEADRQGVRRPVALQNELSVLNRHFETDSLAEACWRLGLRLVAYSPLAGGALSSASACVRVSPVTDAPRRHQRYTGPVS